MRIRRGWGVGRRVSPLTLEGEGDGGSDRGI
jgi:hypothetical protein